MRKSGFFLHKQLDLPQIQDKSKIDCLLHGVSRTPNELHTRVRFVQRIMNLTSPSNYRPICNRGPKLQMRYAAAFQLKNEDFNLFRHYWLSYL
jgi:hypothetical protein